MVTIRHVSCLYIIMNLDAIHEKFVKTVDSFDSSKEAIFNFTHTTGFKRNKFYELKNGKFSKKDIPYMIQFINSSLTSENGYSKQSKINQNLMINKEHNQNLQLDKNIYSTSDTITEYLLLSDKHRSIYLETVNEYGVSHHKLINKYGNIGNLIMNQLIQLGAVKKENNSYFKSKQRANFTENLKKRVLSDIAERIDHSSNKPTDKRLISIFDSIYQGTSLDGIDKINSILRSAQADIKNILDKEKGDNVVLINIITDKL